MSIRKLCSREVGLLLISNITKEYSWLISHLEFGKGLNSQTTGFTELELKMYENNIEHLLTSAEAEWELRDESPLDDLEEERTTCQVCGNSQNRLIFYIRNRITGEEINIGSECRKKFDIKGKVPIAFLLREARRDSQRAKIVKYIPDINKRALFWKDDIATLPVVIPQELAVPFFDICNKIKALYDEYLESKIEPSQEIIDFFNQAIQGGENCLSVIRKYINTHSTEELIATRSIWRWLRYRKSDDGCNRALEAIELSGKVEWIHAWRIKENNFMKSLLPRINQVAKKVGITFVSLDTTNTGDGKYVVDVNLKEGDIVRLSCDHGDIFLNMGDLVFGEVPIGDLKEIRKCIVAASKPYSQSDYNKMLNILRFKFHSTIIFASQYDNDETQQIALYDKAIRQYAWIGEVTLVNILLEFAFDVISEQEAIKLIKGQNLSWLSEKDIKERMSLSKLMKNK